MVGWRVRRREDNEAAKDGRDSLSLRGGSHWDGENHNQYTKHVFPYIWVYEQVVAE